MMKLTVVRLLENEYDVWLCEDEAGLKHRVDLMIDGGVSRDDLVPGTVVEVGGLDPYIEIASEVHVESIGQNEQARRELGEGK